MQRGVHIYEKKNIFNILVFISFILIIAVFCSRDEFVFRNSDIIFQISRSSQSKAIQIATKSKYSHMGIIYKEKGKCYVCEAVQPVKLTELSRWISHGQGKHFVVKRLKNAKILLTKKVQEKMKDIATMYLGRNYDKFFEWSDERIYCSELVWKIYKNSLGIQDAREDRDLMG